MNKEYWVYIIGNDRPTLYVGITCNLLKRIWQHKQGLVKGFSKRYRLYKLLYYETHSDVLTALSKEKRLKKWKRAWKLGLIKTINPDFKDLFENIC